MNAFIVVLALIAGASAGVLAPAGVAYAGAYPAYAHAAYAHPIPAIHSPIVHAAPIAPVVAKVHSPVIAHSAFTHPIGLPAIHAAPAVVKAVAPAIYAHQAPIAYAGPAVKTVHAAPFTYAHGAFPQYAPYHHGAYAHPGFF